MTKPSAWSPPAKNNIFLSISISIYNMNRFICIADRRLLMMFSVNVTATAQVAAAAFATVEPSAYSSKRARLTSAGAGTAGGVRLGCRRARLGMGLDGREGGRHDSEVRRTRTVARRGLRGGRGVRAGGRVPVPRRMGGRAVRGAYIHACVCVRARIRVV